jgi:hypothetical protein
MPGWQPPKWKIGTVNLFLNHPLWKHVDAKLIHIGDRNKYCLVERVLPEGADERNFVLCLTTFIVKYGDDGEIMTFARQPARFYKAPSYHAGYDHDYDVQPMRAFSI